MEKISSGLRERMAAAQPGDMLRLIVTLSREVDWAKGLEQVKEAGFQVESAEEAIRAVFGKASGDAVPGIAGLSSVVLVEPDARAEALD